MPVPQLIDFDEDSRRVPTSPTVGSEDLMTESWDDISQVRPNATRHPEYYFDSGDVVFLVENHFFRVHRHFFVRESEKFRRLFQKTARIINHVGPTMHPLELDDVSSEEFARFLWVFYNPTYSYETSLEHWASILHLSHMWGFSNVKDLAVREMDKLPIPPVDRAVMARAFAVDPARRWLEIAYAALGTREQPLTREEGERLGLDVVLHLAEVRERIRARRLRASEIEASRSASALASQQIRHAAQSNSVPHDWRSYEEHLVETRPVSPARSQASVESYSRRGYVHPPEMVDSLAKLSCRSESPASHLAGSGHGSGLEPSVAFTEEDVEDVRSVFNGPPVDARSVEVGA